MDALVFAVIMVAALAVAALVIGRAQRAPSPDEPSTPAPGEEGLAADDPRDRPGGPGAERDAPHPSELHSGEATGSSTRAEDVTGATGEADDPHPGPGR